ncbi:MAG: glycosyltransferase [Burkholderiaceae bacterium]
MSSASAAGRLREAPRCRTLLLAGGAPDAALRSTLARLLADPDVRGAIDVFGAVPAGGEPPATPSRVHWHPPAAELPDALRTLAPELERNGGADVAWVRAGVRVFARWQSRLRSTLAADPRIGSASPLCPSDPMYSPFDGAAPRDDALDGLDAWLGTRGDGAPLELPAPLAACGVLAPGAWRAILAHGREAGAGGGAGTGAIDGAGGGADEAPPAWPTIVSRAGLVHVACRRVLALAPPDASPSRDGGLTAARELWRDAHPLTGLRWHVAHARDEWRAPGPEGARAAHAAPARVVRLHVAHSWGGGLGSWVRDFCDGDPRGENLVLRSIGVIGAFGQRLALYRGADAVEPIRIWELGLPIHATAIAHLQYRALLAEIVAEFAVDAVIVSSLIGHSLDALRTGLPTAIVAHDHYPFCVAIFAYFDGECRRCDGTRLRACLAGNAGHRFFRGIDAGDWVALRTAFVDAVLEHDAALVAPSPSVGERWRSLMPALERARWSVIPHGARLPDAVPFEPPADGPLRLLVIGRLSAEKGGALLDALLPELARFAEVTLLGCGEDAARFSRRPGVSAVDAFERDALPGLIARARPHLGLQLSIVPETFSYTLTEFWHCGVPVLACRVGSLADRIRDGENGFLVEPDAGAILARLRTIDARRAELAPMRVALRAIVPRSREAMVAEYDALLPPPSTRAERGAAIDVAGPVATASPATGRIGLGPISIDPQVRYRQVAHAFWRYTLHKATHSPRLPLTLRRALRRARG